MQQFNDFWGQADAIGRAVVALLLLMSISAWVLIFWKGWVLKRAATDLTRAVPAFWEAGNLDGSTAKRCCCRCSMRPPCRRARARCRVRAGSIRN